MRGAGGKPFAPFFILKFTGGKTFVFTYKKETLGRLTTRAEAI